MPLDNFGLVRCNATRKGRLFRSSQPDLDALRTLKALGVTKSYRLSHADEGILSWDKERKAIPGVLDDFPGVLRSKEFDHVMLAIDSIDKLLMAGENVILHCSHGRDRTGLAVGAWQLKYGCVSFSDMEEERSMYGVHGLIAWVDLPDRSILKDVMEHCQSMAKRSK